jgi:polysaccharide biosynthesis/export protein
MAYTRTPSASTIGSAAVLTARLLAAALTVSGFGCFEPQPVQTKVAERTAHEDTGPYRIGRDDVLDVLVWKQPQLSGQMRVGADGTITLPLAGQVRAVGLTTAQLKHDLTDRIGRYVHEPNITVRVAEPRSQVFYVLGEVQHPGKYELSSGEVLSQALAEAGGATEFANLASVKIIRRSGDKKVEMVVNYKVVSRGDLSADIPLARGDTVMVP